MADALVRRLPIPVWLARPMTRHLASWSGRTDPEAAAGQGPPVPQSEHQVAQHAALQTEYQSAREEIFSSAIGFFSAHGTTEAYTETGGPRSPCGYVRPRSVLAHCARCTGPNQAFAAPLLGQSNIGYFFDNLVLNFTPIVTVLTSALLAIVVTGFAHDI